MLNFPLFVLILGRESDTFEASLVIIIMSFANRFKEIIKQPRLVTCFEITNKYCIVIKDKVMELDYVMLNEEIQLYPVPKTK